MSIVVEASFHVQTIVEGNQPSSISQTGTVQGNYLLSYLDKCFNSISYYTLEQSENFSRLTRLIKFSSFFEAIPPIKGTYPRL